LSVSADAEEQVVAGRWLTVAALGEDLCALAVPASDRIPRQIGAEEDPAVGEGVNHTVRARWGCDAIDGSINASGRQQCGGKSIEVILGGQQQQQSRDVFQPYPLGGGRGKQVVWCQFDTGLHDALLLVLGGGPQEYVEA
jgi:hypothetical protein